MSGQPTQGSQPTTGQQQALQLLKADDVLKLQHLSDDLKQKYRPIFQQLWNTVQNKPAGGPEHSQARSKLQEFSQKLITAERVSRPPSATHILLLTIYSHPDIPRESQGTSSGSAESGLERRAVAAQPGYPTELAAEDRAEPGCTGTAATGAAAAATGAAATATGKPGRDAATTESGAGPTA